MSTGTSSAPENDNLAEIIANAPVVVVGESARWDPIVPLEASCAPALPPDVLPGPLGDFNRALAIATETPVELGTLAILAATAACVAKVVSIQMAPDYAEPLNVWTLTALEPGNRKSAVMTLAFSPLRDWDQEQVSLLQPVVEQAKLQREIMEDRIKALKLRAQKAAPGDVTDIIAMIQAEQTRLIEVPRVPRLLGNDLTPEKLGILLYENGERLCLVSDEGGLFGTLGGRYSGGIPNLDLMLQSYSGSPVRVDRVSREPIVLHAPALTVALSPQPSVLRSLSSDFLHRGFMDRFLLALPHSPVGFRSLEVNPIPALTKQAYHRTLTRLLGLCPLKAPDNTVAPRVICPSDEALLEWKDFARRIERGMRPGGKLEFLKGWASKLPGNIARVAGLFHLVITPGDRPWESPLLPETMVAAIRLGMALIPHALAVYGSFGADPAQDAARHLLAWIIREGKVSFTARDAFNCLKGRFKRMQDLQPAFQVLMDRHYLRMTMAPVRRGPGRPPSPRYEVSPLLLEAGQ